MTSFKQAALALALSVLSLGALASQDFEIQGNMLTITSPGINLEGQMVPGAVRSDYLDANTGRPATNLQYPQNQHVFEGARVYLCVNGLGWTCGSGRLRSILTGPGDRPFAQGVFQGGKAVLQLPTALTEAQLGNLTGVVELNNGMRGWLHPLR